MQKNATFLFFVFSCFLLVNNSCQESLTYESEGPEVSVDRENSSIEENFDPNASLDSKNKREALFDDSYDDYTDYAESRHLKLGHRRIKHRRPYSHHHHGGCQGHGCHQHGWQPQGGYYNQGNSHGSSFGAASASAGNNFFPGSGIGGSQANAQSASFSLGPYSATFSHAEASAGNSQPFG